MGGTGVRSRGAHQLRFGTLPGRGIGCSERDEGCDPAVPVSRAASRLPSMLPRVRLAARGRRDESAILATDGYVAVAGPTASWS